MKTSQASIVWECIHVATVKFSISPLEFVTFPSFISVQSVDWVSSSPCIRLELPESTYVNNKKRNDNHKIQMGYLLHSPSFFFLSFAERQELL